VADLSIPKLSPKDVVKFTLVFTLDGLRESCILSFRVPSFPKRMSNVNPVITARRELRELDGTTQYGISSYRIIKPNGYSANKYMLKGKINRALAGISKDTKVIFTTDGVDGLSAINGDNGTIKDTQTSQRFVSIDIINSGLSVGSDTSVNATNNYFIDSKVQVKGKLYTIAIQDKWVNKYLMNDTVIKDRVIFAYSQTDNKSQPGTNKLNIVDDSVISESSPPSFSSTTYQSEEGVPSQSIWINPKNGKYVYFFAAVARYTNSNGVWLQRDINNNVIWTPTSKLEVVV